jgi:hypothetical protein
LRNGRVVRIQPRRVGFEGEKGPKGVGDGMFWYGNGLIGELKKLLR